MFLLEETNLTVISFYAFGSNKNENCYRLSVGTCKTEEMEMALAALRLAVENLRLKSLLTPPVLVPGLVMRKTKKFISR